MSGEKASLYDIFGEKGINEITAALEKHIKELESDIPSAKEFGSPVIVEYYEERSRIARKALKTIILSPRS